MGYRVLADATMTAHFAYLAYVVTGGFLAWRRPRAIWPHLALAGWGLATVALHLDCPLTALEDRARRQAGEPGLTNGFIDHYLAGVVYPERYSGLVRLLAAVTVGVSWTGTALRRHGRTHRVVWTGTVRRDSQADVWLARRVAPEEVRDGALDRRYAATVPQVAPRRPARRARGGPLPAVGLWRRPAGADRRDGRRGPR
ncbi:DUF2784 domain-containing protein [Planosporangium thailandense]|uniref:DUF2784 domain-containing protein n=1 Tax=Planosporangium thailandense TaxID=765197 RepID=A0ABX0Y3Z3_9ACTN|nr:DUF2784 domain-containing protein [Planosporangium thailandense]NJC72280.1 DUF2784 domain-containing protein [Planosporangium thailandense]